MKSRLPVPCRLQPGESLPGLFSRAVVTNRYYSFTPVAPHFGFPIGATQFSRSDMRRLAIGDVDLQAVADFTEHAVEDVSRAILRIDPPAPGGRWDDYVAVHSWRFCPQCLREGKSHQRHWLVCFSTACPIHGCELIDQCYRCDSPYPVSSALTAYCSHCQARPVSNAAHPHEIECSERIAGLIDDPAGLKAFLDRLMAAWHLGISAALRPHFRFSPQLRPVRTMRKVVIQMLPAAREARDLADAVALHTAALKARWPHFEALPGLLVQRAIDAGAELPPPGDDANGHSLTAEDDAWLVPVHAAAEAAGLSDFVLRGVIQAKELRSQLFTEVSDDGRRHKFRMVSMQDFHDLIEELFSKASMTDDASELTSVRGLHLAEVIRDVRSGAVTLFRDDGNTLGDLWVRYNQTTRFVRSQRRPADALMAKEACALLGTYHAVVADLVQNGLLTAHIESRPRRLLLVRESVEAFDRNYVLVGTLADQLGLASTNLAEKLREVGVQEMPLGALVSVYRREDVEEVDLKRLTGLPSYSTRTGRKTTVKIESVSNPRVRRLIELVGQHGGASSFGRKFEISIGNLSQIMREQKPFGPLAARRLETRCGLPEGWLG